MKRSDIRDRVVAAVATNRRRSERSMSSAHPNDPALGRIGALLDRLDPTPAERCDVEGCIHQTHDEPHLALAGVGTA